MRKPLGEPGDPALDRHILPPGQWQLLDQARRDVTSHQQPDDRVDDIRVENPTEKMLLVVRERSAQAEDGVGGDDVGGKNCGDEREAVADAGNVAVARGAAALNRSSGRRSRATLAGTRAVQPFTSTVNGLRCLPSITGNPDGPKVTAIFGRIQFTAEPELPPIRGAGGRERRSQPFE